MAIEDTKFVEKIEAKSGGRSGTYWTVTWTDGKFDNIFDGAMKDKCEEAQANGLAVHYTKEKHGNYFNIVSLELVRDALPSATEPIEPAVVEGEEPLPLPPIKEPSGQTVGMCWKEIGELIRTDKISFLFGKENAIQITKEYRSYLLSMLRLPFDGKKLPQWEKEG